jgi:GNAT superfamily N-acetyltransferase
MNVMNSPISIREMVESDPPLIAASFTAQGWNKPVTQYRRYWQESLAGTRVVLLAEVTGDFAGYLNILWDSDYPPFQQACIPEIADFNVLLKFQRMKIGTALMDEAEKWISARSPIAGIGVCLHTDYGAAQVLYARRGYVPDGRGVYSHGAYPKYGDLVRVDDDLTLYLTKPVP